MGEMSTATLHGRADDAAQRGDFMAALAFSAEALRIAPLDHRARLKVALCFSMLGRADVGVDALMVVARTLARRGYMLSAIGACRDAVAVSPGAPAIAEVLSAIHDQIFGVQSRARARVPPPTPPTVTEAEAGESLLEMTDPNQALAKAEELARTDPDGEGGAFEASATPFFSDLSKEAFLSLVPRMGYLKLPPDHVVVKENADGKSLFILLHGEVKVERTKGDQVRELARLGAGSLFGEMALITDKPRSATVVVTQAAEFFEIDRSTVEEVASQSPTITEDIVGFARRRLLMNLMATSKIFQPFDDKQRIQVLRSFASHVAEPGQTIIEEGADPKGLYVVLEGEVEVSKTDESGDRLVLAYLGEGEVFGEIGLVEDRPTTASVTAVEKSVVLVLERGRFAELTADHPKILEYLSTLSGERLEEIEDAMSAEGVILEADDLIIL